ncbi:diacylglycerol/lipid kinase family protein [Streptomyces griseoincarnatus]|uniref:diacylglycerol/lipid kinase family protein n=1 Tax=Streptomyces sp. SMS_SU21 TaxID=2069440 RepID=UPI000C88CEC7|nr:diacylglycerol kinase family protein [Streptomyces sp. SMS_SU21]MCA2201883.1 NAD(+)/NADH kinase [Streptomyces sp. SMS_SU21]NEA92787.1 diacylglycerol kinase [Actinospica acidiphila]
MGVDWSSRGYHAQRWAARGALLAAALAVATPLVYGGLRGLLLLVLGVAGLGLSAAAVWWTLTLRGPLRWGAALVAVCVPAGLLTLFAVTLFWALLVSLALWGLAVWSGRYALRGTGGHTPARERRLPPPRKPVLIMNPRSGGGKVGRFRLREKAERLGARVVLLEPGQQHDVTELARRAVADGADLLGAAGGDGTQALVAAVAAEHDVPFLVISAGTRNHFALDLGLDRGDPAACLDALTDGVELRVDLGFAGDQPFVNNASFGAYAAIVQSPAYRDDKIGTSLEMLPDLLTGQQGPRLLVRAGDNTLTAPQAVLVSNNPYRTGDPFGLGRRERLDSGTLGVLGVKVEGAISAAALLLNPDPAGLTVLTAPEVVIEADRDEIEAGVDGEAMVLPAPVRCRIAPGALRVRVPRKRPGVAPAPPRLDWRRLRKLAATVGRTAAPTHLHWPRHRSRHAEDHKETTPPGGPSDT